jgi:hypothetical protein
MQQQQQQHQQMAGVQVQQQQQIQPQMATASVGDLAQYQHLQQLQQLQHLQQLQQQQSLQKLHAMQQQQRLLSQLGGGSNITQAQLAQLTGASQMNGALGQMNAAGLAQGLNTQGMTPSKQAAFANQLITSQHQHALLEQALKAQKEKEEAEERAALDADYARIAAAARAPAQVPREERVAKRPREEQPARPHHQPTQPVALKVPTHLHLQYQQAQRAVREGGAAAPPAPPPAAPQTDAVAPPGKPTPAVIYPSTGRPSAAMKRSNERSAISLGATVLDEPDPMDGDDWFSMDVAARFKALMPRYARLTAELRDARDALESEVQVRKGLEEALREARREARAAKASEDRIVSSLRSITASNAGLSPEMKARLRMTHETPPMSEEQLRGLIEVPESREGAGAGAEGGGGQARGGRGWRSRSRSRSRPGSRSRPRSSRVFFAQWEAHIPQRLPRRRPEQ